MATPVAIRGPHRWKALELEEDQDRAWVCNGCGRWIQQAAQPDAGECPHAPCMYCGMAIHHEPTCRRPCRNCGQWGHHSLDCPTLLALLGFNPDPQGT